MARQRRLALLVAGLLAAVGVCASRQVIAGFTSELPVGAQAEPGTVIRGEGQPCGGYPMPGEPIALCGKGLVCDFAGAAVDAPGVCRR
jgi:hypothetical protein